MHIVDGCREPGGLLFASSNLRVDFAAQLTHLLDDLLHHGVKLRNGDEGLAGGVICRVVVLGHGVRARRCDGGWRWEMTGRGWTNLIPKMISDDTPQKKKMI